MLKFLRNKSHQKKLFLLLTVLILPSFLIVGVVLDNSNAGPNAGKIGSQSISTGEFLRQYQAVRREIMLFRGIDPDTIPTGSIDFESLTWDRILLLDDAKQKGVRVHDSDIVDWLNNQPAFSTNGKFNPSIYKMIVEKEFRISPRSFEEEIRGFLTLQKSIEAFRSLNSVEASDIRKTFDERFAKRDLSYVVITADPNAAAIAPTPEAEIRQLYDSLGAVMRKPERFKVRYVFADKGGSLAPETKKAMEESGLDKAGEFGLKVLETGLITRGDPLPEIGYSQKALEAIFAIPQGGHTSWVELENGAALFELLERTPSEKMTFEESRPQIEASLAESKKDQALSDRALEVRNAMDSKDFKDVAQENGLEVLQSAGFAHNGVLDKAGILKDFNASVAPLQQGQISQPIRAPSGYVILKVDSISKADDTEWEKQKDVISQELNTKIQEGAFRVNLEKLRSRLKVNEEAMSSLFPEKYKNDAPNPATAAPAAPSVK